MMKPEISTLQRSIETRKGLRCGFCETLYFPPFLSRFIIHFRCSFSLCCRMEILFCNNKKLFFLPPSKSLFFCCSKPFSSRNLKSIMITLNENHPSQDWIMYQLENSDGEEKMCLKISKTIFTEKLKGCKSFNIDLILEFEGKIDAYKFVLVRSLKYSA